MTIEFSYLKSQFRDSEAEEIWRRIKPIVTRGDFTLGKELGDFEHAFATRCKATHAIGVGNGTDALFLSLKALGIRGDVITPPFSFYSTTAAIVHARCSPVFVDVADDMNIDVDKIEAAITPNTECIMNVHWAGRPCNMTRIMEIAANHGLAVIEDAAQAFGSSWAGKPCGGWGHAGALSLHPLKMLNVIGDGGVITTSDDVIAERLRRLRNHGMANRNEVVEWGWNSRLDTIQAAVGLYVLGNLDHAIAQRSLLASVLHEGLFADDPPEMLFAPIPAKAVPNWYLFTFLAQNRDGLLKYLQDHGIEAKCHYPVPIHLQPAASKWGYREGSFPMAERVANETISLPNHEYLSRQDMEYVVSVIRAFYSQSSTAAA